MIKGPGFNPLYDYTSYKGKNSTTLYQDTNNRDFFMSENKLHCSLDGFVTPNCLVYYSLEPAYS